jgi:hypothetical protein
MTVLSTISNSIGDTSTGFVLSTAPGSYIETDVDNITGSISNSFPFTLASPVLTLPFAKTTLATLLTSSTTQLNGYVNPNGNAGSVYFYWGTSPTALGNSCGVAYVTANYSTQPFSCPLSSLASNTTYYYETVFYNSGNGSYAYGPVVSFTTLP